MKRIALSLLAAAAAVVVATPAQAIVGGPFDNNLFYSPSLNGTFQGTISGKNLSGIMIFAIGETFSNSASGSDPQFPNMGSVVSFYKGAIFRGGVEAVPNANTRKIAAVIHGRGDIGINGFMDAKFDNIYPSITYKGKASLLLYWPSVDDAGEDITVGDELNTRVRGIKTSSSSGGAYWEWVW